ncbi:MAG: DNA-protecting protein DprA [Bacteroidetes bacterium]|nr:DNA-protecting protein DprA [Bacteroidota bacterium]
MRSPAERTGPGSVQNGIDIRDLIHLRSIPGISDRKTIALVDHFRSTDAVLAADPRALIKVRGIREPDASAIRHTARDDRAIDTQFSLLNKVNGSLLSYWDAVYPEQLRNIYDPPVLLFLRGALTPADRYSIAMVGTRHPTPYGRAAAETFARELARRSITVVSGLARGVDTIVHRTTLQHQGRTVAVLGGSIDRIYPGENIPLADRIADAGNGAVLSELFMSTPSHPAFFPRRNRIISGMSLGTLIVESDEDGGAMITATTALDQNRELFSIPGSIMERKSAGTNKLIKSGQAKLVQSVDDILVELEHALRPILPSRLPAAAQPQLNVFEQKIAEQLSSEPQHVDLIAERTQLAVSDVLVNLLGLEFKGVVRQMAGKMFLRV